MRFGKIAVLAAMAGCGSNGESEDGGGGGGTATTTTSTSSSGNGSATSGAGATTQGSVAAGGASVTGGSSSTGQSDGSTAGSGKGDIGAPCTMAADCAALSGYEVECFGDWPNGGHCTRACTFDTDCGSAGRCDDHDGGLWCFVDCANRFDPTTPLACPAGYTCSDGESCRPE